MTVVMTMEVRNEADTIEDHIVYHLSLGFAAVVVSDRGSTDGTLSILNRLTLDLPVIVIDRGSEQISSERALARMTNLAAERLGATWVVQGFIDEYWLVGSGSIAHLVASLLEPCAEVVVPATRFLHDPERPDEAADLRENSEGESIPVRTIRRVDSSSSGSVRVDVDECCVAILPPPSKERALQRAVAWGLEDLLELNGRRAASPRWEALFRDYLEDSSEPTLDPVAGSRGIAGGDLVIDRRIAESLRSFDRSRHSAIALSDTPRRSATSLVAVVGMHRSGTSLIARVINLLGVDIGDESQLMEAKPDNPTGFWENRSFASLDDDLLGELGGRWDRPPIVASDWAHDPGLDALRGSASELVGTTFSGSLGLVKDPRMSLLLPFWRTIAPVHSALLVLRPPEAVAASLSRRDRMDPEIAAGLWIDYTLGVLGADPGCDVILYDEFLSDPEAGALSIATILNLETPTPEVLEEIRAFTDPGLRHHDRGANATGPDGPTMALAVGLFEAVSNGDDGHVDIVRRSLRDAGQVRSLGSELDRIGLEWALVKRAETRVIDERDTVWSARDLSLQEIDRLRRRHAIQDSELLDREAISNVLARKADDATRRADAAVARVEALEAESAIARSMRRFSERRTGRGES